MCRKEKTYLHKKQDLHFRAWIQQNGELYAKNLFNFEKFTFLYVTTPASSTRRWPILRSRSRRDTIGPPADPPLWNKLKAIALTLHRMYHHLHHIYTHTERRDKTWCKHFHVCKGRKNTKLHSDMTSQLLSWPLAFIQMRKFDSTVVRLVWSSTS